ncbi:hypothetical protein QQ020_21815 [Fulvivirgaceae bacterium BMA12]|uniref:Uncharacterized protein n=1 Tax=Agaribacillus aureus TaxID=3051825 RepID=A0ABT8LEG7_9BACT|nr:hypothetical protein [Fulvivirgaceae bacterium BMA12]
MGNNKVFKKYSINKLVIGCLLFGFITTGFVDLLLQSKASYSAIMGMDANRVYFYTFFLLVIGCWLLYNKWFVGIGFISLATFSSYFIEYITLHNFFASIAIYFGIIIDIIIQKQKKWLVPLIVIGILQGIAFQTGWFGYYMVGSMEFLALCIGSVFIVKTIQ